MDDRMIEVLAGVHDFYGKELTSFAMEVWAGACKEFDPGQVSKAFSAHLMDPERGQFMPKPADIVRQLQGTRTDRSLLAWGKVLDAMQRVGAYQSVAFDEPVIHATIEDCGGWVAMCRGELDALPFLEKRFCDSYKAYAARGVPAYTAVLPGVHGLENATKGHRSAPPVLIGDPEKAARVIASGGDMPKTQITTINSALEATRLLGGARTAITGGRA